MKKFYKYFKADIPSALLGIFFVAAVAYIELYQIKLMAQIIDVGIANSDMGGIVNVGLKMVALAILGAIIAMLGLYFPSQVSNNFVLRLREDLYKRVQTFSIKNLSEFQTASLITRLTNDANFIQRTLMMCLRLLVRAPVFLFSTLYATYKFSGELTWITAGAVLFMTIVLMYIIVSGFPRFVRLQKMVDKMNRKVQETLMNIRVIKSFVREDYEADSFETENQELFDANVTSMNLMIIMNPALTAAIGFATIFTIWVSSNLIVNTGVLKIGDLSVLISNLRFTMFSMMMLTNVLQMISRSKASFIRIGEILDTYSDITDSNQPKRLQNAQGYIRFNDVSFKYFEDASNVLSNINLEIKPQQHIGIIGSTGSGKSTLINLLGRLIDVTEGSITFDNIDIRELDIKNLRAQFGFVPQKNLLFAGTISENLRLGNEHGTIEQMIAACKAASIYDFIQTLPKGFDAPVYQGGSNFSGGQRQRLCIARALMMNPKVLILDDSTSALDAATEKSVKESVAKHFANTTVISIAQKISSVADSDLIVVMDEGQIVGQGTHLDLLDTCSVYQEIYNSQMQKGGE